MMNEVSNPCLERELLLHGLADGELDAANALALEDHLQSCGECAAAYNEILGQKQLLRSDGLRFRAPESLRGRVLAAIAAEDGAGAEATFVKPARPSSKRQAKQPQAFPFWVRRGRVLGHGAGRKPHSLRE